MVYVVLNLVLFGFKPKTFLGFSSWKNICIVLNLYETEAGNDKLEVLYLYLSLPSKAVEVQQFCFQI